MSKHYARLFSRSALLGSAFLLSSVGWTQKSQAPPPVSPTQQAPPPQQTPPSQPTSAQADAAAIAAAERMRRFDALKQQLENGGGAGHVNNVPSADSSQTPFISPARVHILVGDDQPYCVFDIDGHDLTASAQWLLTSQTVAVLEPGGPPSIVAKAAGNAKLQARIGSRIAETDVNVLSGSSLPMGTTKWEAPSIPGFKPGKITQAVPSSNGPDIYEVEEGEGLTLIRAFTADGRQLWMKRMAGKSNGVPVAN
jgi:hypothetical protein